MIGTDEDIERRLQEQLEGPKEMFSSEERVRQYFFASVSRAASDMAVDPRAGTITACLHCDIECTRYGSYAGWEVRPPYGYYEGDQ